MSNDDFLIVGIGASAGGIQAIKQFFQQVPPDSDIAFVVVLHLSPEHESRLAEVLQMSTTLPVAQVRQRIRVEPNHVYVIPPHQSLSMQGGFLLLSPVAGFEERRAPVDIFFRTLAESHGSRAVCVVLSGTGANGSMGMKRVKEHGGVSFVQDPGEAEYNDMPRNSIATGHVDHVLRVAEIPGRIIAYKRSLESVRVPEPAEQSLSDESALREVLRQLHSRTGHDFASYKRPTVLRRIARRLSLHQLPDLQSYAAFFRDHPEELQPLLKDLLISVTNFFRDREAYDALERRVIPSLFADKGEDDQVRIWVAGCATGEEAYSIGMLMTEHAAGLENLARVQIFGTDIDDAALAVAREGLYTANDAADVSPERLQRFFVKEGERFRVRPELREMILFAKHNIIKDPPFSHLDLISCRNLLIYLNRAAQQHVLEVMHFALNPGKYLFLGSSESSEGSGDLFVTVDKDAHLFQSRAMATRMAMPMPHLSVPEPRGAKTGPADFPPRDSLRERLSAADIHHRLLEQYAPPSIVVDEEHEIVHLSEHAGRYLHYVAGEPSNKLMKAIRPELRIDVRTALYQAAQQRTNVEATGLSLRVDNRAVRLDVLVRPVLRDDDPARGFFLLVFRERLEDAAAAETSTPLAVGDAARQLEEEMLRVKARLQATVERHETQAEELKASNEELQAMNEELRSSAEELETSKEELQSLNEELRTVNQELKVKVEEQAQANDDIQNLINSTDIGTIFLDRASRIKLFTPRARDLFTLIPADRGRPLSDMSSLLVDDDLHGMVERVLDRLEPVEREVKGRNDRWYLMRAHPYRTADHRIDGVVITSVDITARKQTEEQLRWSESRYRLIVESVTEYAIFTTDATGLIDTWNPGAAGTFGYADLEAIGQPVSMLFTPDDRSRGVPQDEMRRADRDGHAVDERWHLRRGGPTFFASGVTVPLRDEGGTVTGFVKIARDLTERKRWEDELRQAHADLEVRVQERTQQLKAANKALDVELGERRHAEEQIRGLMRRLVTVQEDERHRLSRDLHDQLGQHLAGLGLKLDALTRHAGAGALDSGIEDVRRTIEKLDSDLDFFTWELRPAALDHLGLAVTLGTFVREWSKEFRIPAEFQSRGLDSVRLAFETETNLYRIVQEALNNVYKHAHANRVGVILERRDDQAVLVVEDDGVGFDRAETAASGEDGIGLIGIHERAAIIGGSFEVETAAGRGTTIFVKVPLPPVSREPLS